MIDDSFGPEIAEAYEIPTEDFERLSWYQVEQIRSQLGLALISLPASELPQFKTRLRAMLTVAECQKTSDLYHASTLSQQMFMAAYSILMGWK